MTSTHSSIEALLPGDQAVKLFELLATWRNTTTVVVHEGCVFEYKGVFPEGSIGQGYFNLEGGTNGFHGHLRLDAIAHIGLQGRPHRGRESYAFVFLNRENQSIFKVFIGRDDLGDLLPDQVASFKQIQATLSVTPGSENSLNKENHP